MRASVMAGLSAPSRSGSGMRQTSRSGGAGCAWHPRSHGVRTRLVFCNRFPPTPLPPAERRPAAHLRRGAGWQDGRCAGWSHTLPASDTFWKYRGASLTGRANDAHMPCGQQCHCVTRAPRRRATCARPSPIGASPVSPLPHGQHEAERRKSDGTPDAEAEYNLAAVHGVALAGSLMLVLPCRPPRPWRRVWPF